VKTDVGNEDDDVDASLVRGKMGAKPILYSLKNELMPREVILGFLQTCVKMMLMQRNLDDMIDECISKKTALHDAAVGFQRDVLEYNFQIERDYGCKYLAMIPTKHADDIELVEAMKEFMLTAMRSFLSMLARRSERYKNGDIIAPNPALPLTSVTISEFLEGCNALSKFIL
jgi:hypothetical protein